MAYFGRAAVLALCLLSWRSRCAALVIPESETLSVALTKLAAASGLTAPCQEALRGLSSNLTQPATVVDTMVAITQARVATGRVMEALPMMNMVYSLGLMRKGTRKQGLASFPVVSVGNPDACAFIRDFHYCRLDLGYVLVRFGVCMPTACGASDVAIVLNNTYHNYDYSGGMAPSANRWLSPKMPLRETTYCGADAYSLPATTGTRIMLAITVALVVIALIATAVDMLRTHLKAPVEDRDAVSQTKATEHRTRWFTTPSMPLEALLCWSLVKNFRGLIAKQRGGAFDCLDGIRALAGLWIIYSHTGSYGALDLTYTNNYQVMRLGTTAAGQPMFQGFYAVDTFLFIGGFLAIHLMLRLLERARVSKDPRVLVYMGIRAPRLYVLRYIRLTPAYAYALFMYWQVLRVADRGPFFTSVLAPEYAACRASWFANMLYINNFWDQVIKKRPGTCFGATWYLALDFQLFLLTPFVAALAWWRHKVALSLLALATLCSLVFTYVESNRRRWTLDWMESLDYYQTGYVLPWFRAPPYLIGMGLAIVWHRYLSPSTHTLPHATRHAKPLQSSGRKETAHNLVMAAAIALFGVVAIGGKGSIGSMPTYWSQGRMDAYITLSKPAWALALCCICVVMFRGGGGWIRALLECRPLLVVSRLTYCMYLIHIPVLQWLYGMMGPLHYSTIWFMTTYYGVVVVTILLSTFTYLLVESPVSMLVKLLTTSKSKHTVHHKDEEESASAAPPTAAAVKATSLTLDAPSVPTDESVMTDSRSHSGAGGSSANEQ